MRVLVAGLNHNSAGVEVREKLAFGAEKLESGLRGLRALDQVKEALIISTCNRVEIYAGVLEPEKARDEVLAFLSAFHQIEPALLSEAVYFYTDSEAVSHVFKVASSLDSMIIGEPQILGQVKDAFEFSLKHKATGALLNKLLKKAISVAKRVRTETKIAENAVSISFAAVELAKKIFTDLSDKSVLLLGAGEMAELAARHLQAGGVREIIVANRTFERGLELAGAFCGRAAKFEEFKGEMLRADIVICSTGASDYIFSKHDAQHAMKERKHKPMFIIDISVPRNIEPAVNDVPNIYLYDVDDLQGVVDTNLDGRRKEAEHAAGIIAQETESFERWVSSQDSVPAIVALRKMAEDIKESELAKLMSKTRLPDKDQKAVECMASAIVNKLLHPPTAALKEEYEDREALVAAIRKLFLQNGRLSAPADGLATPPDGVATPPDEGE